MRKPRPSAAAWGTGGFASLASMGSIPVVAGRILSSFEPPLQAAAKLLRCASCTRFGAVTELPIPHATGVGRVRSPTLRVSAHSRMRGRELPFPARLAAQLMATFLRKVTMTFLTHVTPQRNGNFAFCKIILLERLNCRSPICRDYGYLLV